MADYTKTTWVDEVPNESPPHYVITGDVSDCHIQLKNTPTTVGTPLNASNLNKIENQLELISIPSPVLLDEIVATGVADELNFTSIPTGYGSLKLIGPLKQTFTGGTYPATNINIRLNNDSGNNYFQIDWWPPGEGGWDAASSQINSYPVVGSWPTNASFINHLSLTLPDYESSFYKMCSLKQFSYNYQGNPTGGHAEKLVHWRSSAVVNRIQVFGTFVSTVSYLRLYGIPIFD